MAALSGIRVLDLSRILAGPWCTQVLSDLGADVIKVERPGAGDDTRSWRPPVLKDQQGNPTSESAYFLAANRGKRSIAVDLKNPEGQALIKELAAHCDILVENYKVGQLKKFGLDYESLHALCPALIYCSITGFGQTGPYAPRAGYDYIVQAMSGLMSVTGERDELPGGGPMRAGVAVADLFTGSYAIVGILAALYQREHTKVGQHVDLALFDTMVSMLSTQNMNALTTGQAPKRTGVGNPNVVPYQVFYASDKPFVLAIGNDAQFGKFCAVAGCPELSADTRFATNAARLQHRDVLVSILSSLLKTRTADQWFEACDAINVPAGPINSITEALNDPQILSRGMRFDLPHPLAGSVPMVANPVHLSDSAPVYHHAPPLMAQHTDEVLREFGLSNERIAALRLSGAVA